MGDFFRKAGRSLKHGLSEGMEQSQERDNDYNDLNTDVDNPSVGDDALYEDFINFCKKYKTSPQQDANLEALLVRMVTRRPSLAQKFLKNKK